MDVIYFFSHIELLQENWLWLLFPVLIILLAQVKWANQSEIHKQTSQYNLATVKHPLVLFVEKQKSSSGISTPYNIKSVLFSLICSGLILLALAQPVRLGEVTKAPATSADVMLIIDTSISMVIKDYVLGDKRVDRLSMTQALLDRFSQRFSGKRIGLVVLGEQPQILLKPSQDKSLVRHLIYRLKSTVSGRQAALGDAVSIATDYLKINKLTAQTVLVLISDGVQPSGKLSPIAGAKHAAKAGVILHTIAIGSKHDSRDETNTHNNPMGELIYESADLALLKQMAELTGGESFHGVDVEAIDSALEKIDKRHINYSISRLFSQRQQPLYAWPLLSAIFLLLLRELLINRHKKVQAL